jgi:hypothetical protein
MQYRIGGKMEENIQKKLGKVQYNKVNEFLKNNKLSIEGLMKLPSKERIEEISKLCNETGLDFKDVYSAFETAKEEEMKKYALRSAIAAILARDGPVPQDPQRYNDLKRRIKTIENEEKKKEERKKINE